MNLFKTRLRTGLRVRINRCLYGLLEPAGEGLESEVWKAIRIDGQNAAPICAIKFFKSVREQKTPAEIDLLKSISCTPRLLDCGHWRRRPAIVMEWIDGVSLKALIQSVLVVDSVAANYIVYQLGQALNEVHSKGLPHGDVSPQNLLFDRSGRLWLVDFSGPSSDPKQILGSRDFLAPERWLGEAPSVAADIFAIGAIRNRFQQNPEDENLLLEILSPDLKIRMCAWKRYFSQLAATLTEDRKAEVREVLRKLIDEILKGREFTTAHFQLARGSVFPAGGAAVLVGCLMNPVLAHVSRYESVASISIRSECWARVAVDGVDRGFAPADIALAPGPHRITFSTNSDTRSHFVSLEAGERVLFRGLQHRNGCLVERKMKP